VPPRPQPLNALIAIATDLLAQSEARHRTALRIEKTAHQVSRRAGANDRATVVAPIDLLRDQLRAMRELLEGERALLEELERQLAGESN
jgi:hypothetical protein